MGYQDVTLYRLKFADRDGLEVTAEGLSAGELLDLMDLTAKFGDKPDAEAAKLDPEMRHVIESLMEILAGSLVEWNIENRRGQPVPCTLAGVKTLKMALVMDIITAWTKAQAEVDDDLGKESPSGGSSALAASLPMAPLSPSPGS